MRELLARIKAVMRRRTPQLADEVVEFAGLRLDPAARRASAGGHELQLWATEFRILNFFMTHPGRIFGRARLLDEIWGDHVFVEERTVDVHIRRLRQALAPSGHETLIETVRGVGYRLRTEPVPAPAAARQIHSTVTDLARFRGLSTSVPRAKAA
jgi:two-component system phosphate regulon response regulator PhoB